MYYLIQLISDIMIIYILVYCKVYFIAYNMINYIKYVIRRMGWKYNTSIHSLEQKNNNIIC